MKYKNRLLSLALILILGFLLGTLGCALWDKKPPSVAQVKWSPEAQWITTQEPNYHLYARHTFYLADTLQGAWLQISAENNFKLFVNGKAVAEDNQYLFQSVGASAIGSSYQSFNDSQAYAIKTDPIWRVQPRDWKLTVYVDLTSYLQPGKNVIALRIKKSEKTPRAVIQGKIYPVSGADPIDITTGVASWRISNLSENHQQLQWFAVDFPDQSWAEAKISGPVQEATYSRLSDHLFDRFLQGMWISGTESPKGEAWLRGNWQISEPYDRAFIRFAGKDEYALMINGLLVNRYSDRQGRQLHMYEVTNFLKPGMNTLAVRLARPLEPSSVPSPGEPTGFFLDGWAEAGHKIVTSINTDETWVELPEPVSGWEQGSGQGESATVLRPANPQAFQRIFEGDAYLLNYPDNLLHYGLWRIAGVGFAGLLCWGLGRLWLDRHNSVWKKLETGAALVLPGTLFLIGVGLLKHRYAETEKALLFAQPQTVPLILLGFVAVVSVSLLWSWLNLHSQNQNSLVEKLSLSWLRFFSMGLVAIVFLDIARQILSHAHYLILILFFLSLIGVSLFVLRHHPVMFRLRNWCVRAIQTWSLWGQWFILVLIVGIGFGLRAYNLESASVFADESTSLDAARSILHTGIPKLASDVWYTRSPVYHYGLAFWLGMVGDSVHNGRLLSALWGTATLVLVFLFSRQITGRIWIALIVTAIFSLDPWNIIGSRVIRFYQPVQFMSLLSFYLFFKGFVDQRSRFYQYLFFICLTLTLLTQEVSVILLPCFLVGFLFFYRPFRLSIDWPIVASSVVVTAIFMFDIIFFNIKCLTPLVALSTTTGSIIQPHLWDITTFGMTFLIGPTRMYILYSLFFCLGFFYFVTRRNGKILFLFGSALLYLVLATILIMEARSRYFYPLHPLFTLLSVYSAVCIMESLSQKFETFITESLPLRNVALGCIALLLVGNMELSDVLAGYKDPIVAHQNELYEYIDEHRQTGDVVATSAPQGAALVLNGTDYFLRSNLRFDALYRNDGEVIDRWAGGVVVSNLDQINRILEESSRVWIVISDGDPVENPQETNFDAYLYTLGKPVFESYGGRIRLWQRGDGLLPHTPNQGKDLGSY